MAKPTVEFRKDLVSGDWVLVSSSRQKKPDFYVAKEKGKAKTRSTSSGQAKKNCPFEDPQKSGNEHPVLWYEKPDASGVPKANVFENWFVQIIPNKYPLLQEDNVCPVVVSHGTHKRMEGKGFHEVIITRDHDRPLWKMEQSEIELVLKIYQDRYKMLEKDECIEYILIFHNEGELAGASVPHPHSQLIALPIVPPDVSGSINGALEFFEKERKCVHCLMLEEEKKDKKRVIYQNEKFIVVVPFASRVPYEIRIFPLEHSSDFEETPAEDLPLLADALKESLLRIRKVLKSPDYNFFIHTSSAKVKSVPYYHWHIEILPRTYEWAGMELGTGIEVASVTPEQAADDLRKAGK